MLAPDNIFTRPKSYSLSIGTPDFTRLFHGHRKSFLYRASLYYPKTLDFFSSFLLLRIFIDFALNINGKGLYFH